MTDIKHSCENCSVGACKARDEKHYPKFCVTTALEQDFVKESLDCYKNNEETKEISLTSACIEGEFYCQMTRVEETLEFIKRMGYKKIGIATCVGLLAETRILCRILQARGIEHTVVCCKAGAIDKTELGLPNEKKVNHGCAHESMCNPVLQAKTLEEAGTDFNIMMGLCIGHDTIFLQHSKAPTTVLVVKDRVLGHNPVMSLYMANGSYSRFKEELKTR